MDAPHIIVTVLVAISIVVPIVGFWLMTRRQERDEAIDAAIFLAQRQLDEYLRGQRK